MPGNRRFVCAGRDPAWYDRENPHKALLHRSRVHFGWSLLITALIPFGFWLIDVGVIPLPIALG